MSNRFEPYYLRIVDNHQQLSGAGIYLGGNLALTCAHVVSTALLGSKERPAEAPKGTFQVDFALHAANQMLRASLHEWKPKEDIAVIRLEGEIPAGARAAEWLRDEELWNHLCETFGFPASNLQGGYAEGVLRDEATQGWLQISGQNALRYSIQPGFSGGPVWDDELKGIVGMVNAADVAPGKQEAYCIPTKLLLQHWPDLQAHATTAIERKRGEYLAYLKNAYQVLDFKGMTQLEQISHKLPLEEVYVPLLASAELPKGETWDRRMVAGRAMSEGVLSEEALAAEKEHETATLPVEEAIAKQQRMVILGDPGSGKSTLLKHLALSLANTPASEKAPLPILISLNAYAAAIAEQDLSLQDYLPEFCAKQSKAAAGMGQLFNAMLEQGNALVLLDGLDEVQEQRGKVVKRVETFANEIASKGNKIIVTSRIVGYRDNPLDMKNLAHHTLLDFDQKAIESFAQKWCTAFEKSVRGDIAEAVEAAEKERQALLEAVEANPGVRRLAANPLLLTILALIKRQGVTLPNRRVELYDLYLRTLIQAWSKARSLDGSPIGPEMDYQQTLAVLSPLALWLREENPTAGLASERDILGWLTRHYMGPDWQKPRGEALTMAGGFLKSVRKYSNLLLERGEGQYGFIHLTLEEMLAAYGVELAGQDDLKDSLKYISDHLSEAGWRETILLAVGIWGLVNKHPKVAGRVVQAMLAMECDEQNAGRNTIMAGECLEDVGKGGLDLPTVQAVIAALEQALLNRSLPPRTQRDAGFVLGRLAVGSAEILQRIRPDLDDFIRIPAGEFQYGNPAKSEHIEHAFEIAKYPVTNLQYRRFWLAGGYTETKWWSEQGRVWLRKSFEDGGEKEPRYWRDLKWNNPLAPVVGVCWYEAEAFCNWLSHETGKQVRLPNEEEWERSARGTEGRDYPWGKKFNRDLLNCAAFWKQDDFASYASELPEASTTMAGQFPGGSTPEGINDLSGNVWEWTDSWYDKENRVLRGGLWGSHREYALAVWRNWDGPHYRNNDYGFRCARSL